MLKIFRILLVSILTFSIGAVFPTNVAGDEVMEPVVQLQVIETLPED